MKLYPLISQNEDRITVGGLPQEGGTFCAEFLSLEWFWRCELVTIIEICRWCREADAKQFTFPILARCNGRVASLQKGILDIYYVLAIPESILGRKGI